MVVEDTIGAAIKAHSPPISGFVDIFVIGENVISFPDIVILGVELYGVNPKFRAAIVLLMGFIERTDAPLGPGAPTIVEPILEKLYTATLTLDGNVPNIIAPNKGDVFVMAV
jgi:hypothetical protein